MDKKKESKSKLSEIIAETSFFYESGKKVYDELSELKDLNDSIENKDLHTYYLKKKLFPGGGLIETLAMELINSTLNSVREKIFSFFK